MRVCRVYLDVGILSIFYGSNREESLLGLSGCRYFEYILRRGEFAEFCIISNIPILGFQTFISTFGTTSLPSNWSTSSHIHNLSVHTLAGKVRQCSVM